GHRALHPFPTRRSSDLLIARAIKREILEETGLTASAGVSYNKFLAKTASGMNKPDGLTLIRPEEASAFLAALPIERFYGVGEVRSEEHTSELQSRENLV